jgi:hypothetical protein
MSFSPMVSRDEGRVIFDLGQFTKALYRSWPLLTLLVILGAMIGAVVFQVIRIAFPRYDANAYLILIGSKYRLNLDPRFTTVDVLSSAAATVNRADEYRIIISSPETRELALETLQARGVSSSELVAASQASLRAEIRGNVIAVRTTASSADLAARFADAYAHAARLRLDEVYATTDQDFKILENKLNEAIMANEAAEAALIKFLETSYLPLLSRSIDQQSQLLTNLIEQRRSAIESQVARDYSVLSALERIHRDATMLEAQLKIGSQSSASRSAAAISLLLLQRELIMLANSNQTYTVTSAKSDSLQISRDASNPVLSIHVNVSDLNYQQFSDNSLLVDVQSLLRLVEIRRAQVLDDIATSASILANLTNWSTNDQFPLEQLGLRDAAVREAIVSLTADLSRKEAERRAATFRYEALLDEAKLTKESRLAIAAKVQERAIAAASTDRAIVVTSAVPVEAYPPLSWPILVGGTGALVLGVVIVLVRQSRRNSEGVDAKSETSGA